MSNYTRWYRSGTVSVTKGSKAVTGFESFWSSAALNPGDLFTVDPEAVTLYEVDSITDNTHLTLKTAFNGNSQSNVPYSIIRNFTSSMQAQTASRTADLLGDMARYISNDLTTLTGKSAYQIAQDNGYTGTQAQWLDDLKGGGEITAMKKKYAGYGEASGDNIGYAHNGIFRGKDLGATFTSAQRQAIKSGTFDDLYLGDFWHKNINDLDVKYIIVGFDYKRWVFGLKHDIVLWCNSGLKNVGGYLNGSSQSVLAWGLDNRQIADTKNLAFGSCQLIENDFYDIEEVYINPIFPADDIIPFTCYLPTTQAYNSSAHETRITAGKEFTVRMMLPSLSQLTSITGYTAEPHTYFQSRSWDMRFPIMNFQPHLWQLGTSLNFWVRDTARFGATDSTARQVGISYKGGLNREAWLNSATYTLSPWFFVGDK